MASIPTKYQLGWLPDRPDPRDLYYSPQRIESLEAVYLKSKYRFCPPYSQGQLGSCTAQAIAFQVQFNLLNNRSLAKYSPFTPSRLFIYYYERAVWGYIPYDSGAYLRDGIKVIANYGAPSEDLWKYDIARFTEKPPAIAHQKGLDFQALKYERIDNTDKRLIVTALQNGLPICFGIYVYDSFMDRQTAATGIVRMPSPANENLAGGHAMVIVGYRPATATEGDTFIVRNSWGSGWGQQGYCRIPTQYLTNPNLADDFWVISEME